MLLNVIFLGIKFKFIQLSLRECSAPVFADISSAEFCTAMHIMCRDTIKVEFEIDGVFVQTSRGRSFLCVGVRVGR